MQLRRLFQRTWLWPGRRQIHTPAAPLRVLFCGADAFSAASLERLHQERQLNKHLIESLDVVCKAGKPTGPGLKTIKHVPIKQVAQDLGLPLHQIPTFTGWTPPRAFNLIIAVSFGLRVPQRLLKQAQYGGLNLHPSLLPDLRGPAPLHHTLLLGRQVSGVTLQTLHPQEWDRGLIIDQTTFELPRQGQCTLEELRDFVSPRAANLLIENLCQATFLDAEARNERFLSKDDQQDLVHARKIIPQDSHVDWAVHDSNRILRTQNALGSLWSQHPQRANRKNTPAVRVKWHNLRVVNDPVDIFSSSLPGPVRLADGQTLVIKTVDGQLLSPSTVTVEGHRKNLPSSEAIRFLDIPQEQRD